jgi:hypothetical protein
MVGGLLREGRVSDEWQYRSATPPLAGHSEVIERLRLRIPVRADLLGGLTADRRDDVLQHAVAAAVPRRDAPGGARSSMPRGSRGEPPIRPPSPPAPRS